MATYSTRIKDARGVEHLYAADPFPGTECFDLALDVSEILSSPGGQLLQSLLPLLQLSALTGEGFKLAQLDFGKVNLTDGVQGLIRMLIRKGGGAFVRRLLSKTRRSVGPADKARDKDMEDLGELAVFDRVFAGNTEETLRAVLWATEVNWAPFTTGDTRAWSGLFPQPGSVIPDGAKTSETPNSKKP